FGDELLVAAALALDALGRRQACALGAVHEQWVGGDETRTVEDMNLGLGLAHIELATDEACARIVAKRVNVNVALEVDDAVMEAIDGRAPSRQRDEQVALGREQVAATGVELAAESGVDLVAPGDGLLIGVVEVAELASGEEVALHVLEQPLDDGGAIGVALLVSAKLEASILSESGHLGYRHHVRAGTAQHDHTGVVDHADGAGAADVVEGVVEEDLALEPCEPRVQLHEGEVRVGQREPGNLYGALAATDVGRMGRGVVLHLLTWLVVVASSGLLRLAADAVATAVRGQRLVGELSALCFELLVNTHQVALALSKLGDDLVVVGLGLLDAVEHRHLARTSSDDLLGSVAGHAE